ncbi:MAG TPA: hypothetical protein VNU19_21110 [Candidatus Acidoferrum sp.]|jgi:hypothetical protein|nr:hypothetical protein [Candidatus Acidoferrum sp.]
MTLIPTNDVYLDQPWVLMRWDPEHQCVFAEWRAFATSAEFRGAMTMALAVGQDHRAISFVSDTRNLEVVTDEDQFWIRHTWAPMAIAAGLKKIGVIIAKRGLSKMAIEHMFKGRPNTGERLLSRKFDSVADAWIWLGEP